jgi:hypothetical protein
MCAGVSGDSAVACLLCPSGAHRKQHHLFHSLRDDQSVIAPRVATARGPVGAERWASPSAFVLLLFIRWLLLLCCPLVASDSDIVRDSLAKLRDSKSGSLP